ncbi:MAG TPA: TIGR03435 family protein [Bryobacteraceae bacterium]|nr:TIGR03435 family protein [Bryobacteraceae bacterium]
MAIRCVLRAGLTFFSSFCCFGQRNAPPEFDAASIKASKPGDIRGSTFQFVTPGGGLEVVNATLKAIIETAYDSREFQISGGPAWIDSERYDITARSAFASAIPETRRKLRALLAQRFHLEVHRETKELPQYVLGVAGSGSKIAELTAAEEKPGTANGIQASCGRMKGTRATTANLSTYLERQLRRPVVDRTGLSGKRYDFQIEWTPDPGSCAKPSDDADSPDGPSLFTALQETLGLKLEATKGPVEVIVVDRVDRPEPN